MKKTERENAVARFRSQEATIITGDVVLGPDDLICEAVVPDSSTDNYTITLPKLSECPDQRFKIVFVEEDSHSNGVVTVEGEGYEDTFEPGEICVVENIAGEGWLDYGALLAILAPGT